MNWFTFFPHQAAALRGHQHPTLGDFVIGLTGGALLWRDGCADPLPVDPKGDQVKRGHSTGAMTKDERDWVHHVKHHGCLLCELRGYPREPGGPLAEAHHLLSGGIRRGHMFTVGLCPWHHRGALIVMGWNHKTHRQRLGPALSEGSVPFQAEFGPDDGLLERMKIIVQRRKAANVHD